MRNTGGIDERRAGATLNEGNAGRMVIRTTSVKRHLEARTAAAFERPQHDGPGTVTHLQKVYQLSSINRHTPWIEENRARFTAHDADGLSATRHQSRAQHRRCGKSGACLTQF
jgi:hypothetical protein